MARPKRSPRAAAAVEPVALSAAAALRIEHLRVDDLIPYAANARQHGDEQVALLGALIRRYGFINPVLIEGNGTIIGGHGRLLAAKSVGLETVPCIRLSHLNEKEARALRLADNKVAELSTWDEALVAAELKALSDLGSTINDLGWDNAELDKLFANTSEVQPAARTQSKEEQATSATGELDEIGEEAEKVVTRPGDLWILGRHRVICGDSLNGGASMRVLSRKKAKLVITDPPYAIYGSSSGVSSDVADDNMVRPFFRDLIKLVERVTPVFAHVYIHCDWRSWSSLFEVTRPTQIACKNMVVWDKGGSGLGSWFANTHELVFFAEHVNKRKAMRSASTDTGHRSVNASNMVRFKRPHGDERQHNAAKPVDMVKLFLTLSSDAGDLVFDPCAGSGTVLIGCEASGRNCAAVELRPATVDVIVRRWQKLTGDVARLEDSDATFDEVARERAEAAA